MTTKKFLLENCNTPLHPISTQCQQCPASKNVDFRLPYLFALLSHQLIRYLGNFRPQWATSKKFFKRCIHHVLCDQVTIYSADLSKYALDKVDSVFIKGRRAIRARFPNGNPETMGLHTTPTGYVSNAVKWLPPTPTGDALEVHIATPHRDATLFPSFQIGIGGPVHQFDPPQSYWGMWCSH